MSPMEHLRIRAGSLGVITGTPIRSTLIAYIVGCALFMSMLDATIVAAAVPAMSADLHVNTLDMGIVITASLLAMIVMVPVSGWLADRFGARTMFLSGIVLFTASSLAAGLSSSLAPLVIARLAQGVGAALMSTIGRILVLRNADKSEYVSALSSLAIPALIAPVVGPPLGGLLIVEGSWRYIFLMNIPIGVVTFVAAALLIKGGNERRSKPFDLKGFLLAGSALACLVFGLQSRGSAMALLLVGLLAGVAYIRHARAHSHPLLDLSLFRISTFSVAVIGGNLGRLSLGAMPLLLMLLLQVGFGLDALQAGTIAFATALGSISVKFVVGRVVTRFGFRRTLLTMSIFCGALIVGCVLLNSSTSHIAAAFLLVVIGFVRSLHLTLANTLSYADVPEPEISSATSLATTAQYLAMAAGVGLATLAMRISATLNDSAQLGEHEIDAALVVMGVLFSSSWLLFRKLGSDAGAALKPKARQVNKP